MEFKICAKDKKLPARAGVLKTEHGEIETPVFVPVGTQATVKSLTPQDLKEAGAQIILSNTYHLNLRPGPDLIQKLGGLHNFMSWDHPIMTDSGGFQVFSLAVDVDSKTDVPPLVKIDEDGVTFRSHLDGSMHRFTPEKSIEIQQKLGADIILAFDDCPPYSADYEKVKRAMERTHRWATRSLDALGGTLPLRDSLANQALFGIVHGGVFKDLREESAKFIGGLDFDGIAVGGVAVGESKIQMRQALDWVGPYLPDGKPRHLLGVGEVDDLFEAIERGMDMFDCVIPTRLGRMGACFVSPSLGNLENRFRIDITKAKYFDDKEPIDKNCHCSTCQNFSRAYLNHLFRTRELLAYRLASNHNVYFLINLVKEIRGAILNGRFIKLKQSWLG